MFRKLKHPWKPSSSDATELYIFYMIGSSRVYVINMISIVVHVASKMNVLALKLSEIVNADVTKHDRNHVYKTDHWSSEK